MHLNAPVFDFLFEFADQLADLIKSLGPWGLIVFVTLYISVVLAFLPITPFSLAAGAIYGWWGIPIAYLSALVGATLAYFIARTFGRSAAKRLCDRNTLARALERVLDEGSWRIVLLIRLSGVLPFAVQNYTFGVSPIRWRAYVAASAVGLIPGSLVKVWIGKASMDTLNGDMWTNKLSMISMVTAIVITVLLLIYVGSLALRELRAAGLFDEADNTRHPAAE